MHVLGIHGDPVVAKVRIAKATREGVRLGADAYEYPRTFSHLPSAEERDWLRYEPARVGVKHPTILDPTAGGGSIPYEATRQCHPERPQPNCGPHPEGQLRQRGPYLLDRVRMHGGWSGCRMPLAAR